MPYESNFYIAAIGASAGGQDPLQDFFSQMPPNSGIAFIVIPHLKRDYISVADKLLRKHTAMPVCWATQGQEVQPNHVYMLPVNKTMTIEKGHLYLEDRKVDDPSNWAVDIFFKSLAKGEKANAVGIILSGAGSDGTLGSIAIHNQQGMVMVQDPQTAQFSYMPESAMLNDHPAQVSNPKLLADELVKFVTSQNISLRDGKK